MALRDWSLQKRIIGAMLAFAASFLAVLFVLYAWQERTTTVDAFVDTARVVTLTVEGARDEMEAKWAKGVFTADQMREYAREGDMEKILAVIPVVTAWQTAKRKAEEGGYRFRVPKFSPRNPQNQPDELEARVLKELKAKDLQERYVIDPQTNAVRYFRAVRLTEPCLLCHGDPARSAALWGNDQGLDPTGARMEGWDAGEVHGAFEVIYSLEAADAMIARSLGLGGAVAGLVLAAGFVVAWLVGRSISRPIGEAAGAIRRAAAGDFTQEMDPSYLRRGDEVGSMLRDVEHMNQSLSQTVQEVTQAAFTVAGSAGQLSQGTQDLSDRTQQQASAIEQTASAVEQMTSSVKNNADNAQQANQQAHHTAETAEEGGKVVERTVQAMGEVTESSRKIADIINVVNEIAFQTNLLALNAAVEAARAGEAGRGFAVVAGEVRSLAGRSASAAKEIQGLINDSVGKVEQSGELVNQSGRLLKEIIASVHSVADTVGEISAASAEQAQGIDEINKAVAQMDQGVQQNAALVEEASSSSEEMADAARELRAKMQKFQVRQVAPPLAAPRAGAGDRSQEEEPD
jgi:methyl-accepting chemotaxis protein